MKEIDEESMEYKLGFKRYRFVREGVEDILNKSHKRRIPLYTATIAILDCIEDEYEDADVSSHIEKLKELL